MGVKKPLKGFLFFFQWNQKPENSKSIKSSVAHHLNKYMDNSPVMQLRFKKLFNQDINKSTIYLEFTGCDVETRPELGSFTSVTNDLCNSSLFLSLAFLRFVSKQMRSAVMSAGLTPPTLLACPIVCGLTCKA